MTTENGRAFNEWLRAQLKAKKMSQRQLAQQSGVDHSTISRLIRGDRMPSLGTATKLARGLREIRDDADTPHRTSASCPSGPRTRPPASSTRCAPTRRCRSPRSARSWSTTWPFGCAASRAPTPASGPPNQASAATAPRARRAASTADPPAVTVGGVTTPVRLRSPAPPPRYGAVRPSVRPPTRTPGRP